LFDYHNDEVKYPDFSEIKPYYDLLINKIMQMNKIIIKLCGALLFSVFFVIPSFSQDTNIDTLRLQRLDTDITEFIKQLGDFVSSTKGIENPSEINKSAVQINNSSIVLLDSIHQVIGLNNSSSEIFAGMFYGLSGAFSQSYPALSAFYSSLASTTVVNSKAVPKYYETLKDVRDTSYKMSKNNKIKRLEKLHLRMQNLHMKLSEIE
jgi:hypothetical protein